MAEHAGKLTARKNVATRQALRILMVVPGIAAEPSIGTHQRTRLLHRALSRHGEVDVVVLQHQWGAEQCAALESVYGRVCWVPVRPRGGHGAWRLLRPLNPRLVAQLARNLDSREFGYQRDPQAAATVARLIANGGYDLLVSRYLRPAALAGLLDERQPCHVIVDLDDHDAGKYASRLQDPAAGYLERLLARWQMRAVGGRIPEQLARCAHVWVSNPNDCGQPGLAGASLLPNVPFTAAAGGRPLPLEPAREESIAVVAAGNYKPNVRGISHFVTRIWPRIYAARSGARLRIFGARISERHRQRWSAVPGVQVVGFVEDIIDAYRDAAFSIAPIYSGGGTNIKVIESLWLGRACVVTQMAWRGYEEELRDGESLLVAHDDDSFADHCLALLGEPALRDAVAAAGARRVRECFCPEVFDREVATTVGKLFGESRSGP